MYETGVKGHLELAKCSLNPSVSKGLDAVGTHYISPLGGIKLNLGCT